MSLTRVRFLKCKTILMLFYLVFLASFSLFSYLYSIHVDMYRLGATCHSLILHYDQPPQRNNSKQ